VRSREGVPLHSPNTYFTHAIQADPYYAEARYQQARFFMNRGRYKTARDSLRRLLSIFPAHARAHARLGMIYYYLTQPQMAAQAYRTALTINPDDYNTHYNLGELYYSTDRTHKALAQFKKALSLRPAHVQANFKTGLIALNNGMVNEAIRYLTRAAEHDKDNIRILLQLAVAYERQDSPEKALRVYRRITGIDPLNRIALQKIDMLSADAQTRR
jgi:tetratricopeptide (TPR) repeat protein